MFGEELGPERFESPEHSQALEPLHTGQQGVQRQHHNRHHHNGEVQLQTTNQVGKLWHKPVGVLLPYCVLLQHVMSMQA